MVRLADFVAGEPQVDALEKGFLLLHGYVLEDPAVIDILQTLLQELLHLLNLLDAVSVILESLMKLFNFFQVGIRFVNFCNELLALNQGTLEINETLFRVKLFQFVVFIINLWRKIAISTEICKLAIN